MSNAPEVKHTATPWRVENGTDLIWGACNPDDQSSYGMGYPIVEGKAAGWKPYKPSLDEREANAAFICEAVNNYETLRARNADLQAALDVISVPADVKRLNEEIRRLTERCAAYRGQVEAGAAQLAGMKKALEAVTVYKIEGSEDHTCIRVCGCTLHPVKVGTPAERAFLRFDALQRAALKASQ